mmetsp:Transcript_19300/g.56158  ORF Transcript_19300/g.56158 Transcript_19300/m.56158 type:complete len:336 (-) Transcript_19300:1504-2511(-)
MRSTLSPCFAASAKRPSSVSLRKSTPSSPRYGTGPRARTLDAPPPERTPGPCTTGSTMPGTASASTPRRLSSRPTLNHALQRTAAETLTLQMISIVTFSMILHLRGQHRRTRTARKHCISRRLSGKPGGKRRLHNWTPSSGSSPPSSAARAQVVPGGWQGTLPAPRALVDRGTRRCTWTVSGGESAGSNARAATAWCSLKTAPTVTPTKKAARGKKSGPTRLGLMLSSSRPLSAKHAVKQSCPKSFRMRPPSSHGSRTQDGPGTLRTTMSCPGSITQQSRSRLSKSESGRRRSGNCERSQAAQRASPPPSCRRRGATMSPPMRELTRTPRGGPSA